ncbi:unnamed protein product [Dovyalis caffra]|uniref:Glycosyltransferase n=1 Tax=Dovyalis caffra TaxID=77055 RepID=A0AAV1S1U3_9ROSI|nr:unnamed protein product [Dovyalis caffra]
MQETGELWDSPSITSYINNVSQIQPSIPFSRLPPVFVDTTPCRSRAAIAFDSIRLNGPHVLQSLKEISKTGKTSAFIIDLFCSSAFSLAKDLKILTYYFFHFGKSFKDLKDTILHFPGMPPLKAIHIPEPMLDIDDPAYHDVVYFCSCPSKADRIIVNTSDDLEPKAIDTLASGICVPDASTPATYNIGPGATKRQRGVYVLWKQRMEQVQEMPNGLERSGQRFLWVLKNPFDAGKTNQTDDVIDDFALDAILPDGFLKRIQDKALVVKSWAPQVAVLNHGSVGGFVTHCGWNSVLEAVVAGVPMVAWPLYAEQHLNRNLLVEDMKMAIPVEKRDEDGFVSDSELEKRVRELMESNKGREMRERSWKIRGGLLMRGESLVLLSKPLLSWLRHGSKVKNRDFLVKIKSFSRL